MAAGLGVFVACRPEVYRLPPWVPKVCPSHLFFPVLNQQPHHHVGPNSSSLRPLGPLSCICPPVSRKPSVISHNIPGAWAAGLRGKMRVDSQGTPPTPPRKCLPSFSPGARKTCHLYLRWKRQGRQQIFGLWIRGV